MYSRCFLESEVVDGIDFISNHKLSLCAVNRHNIEMHLLVVYCSVSVSVQKYITPTVSGQQMKVDVYDSSYNGEVLLGFKSHMNITLKKPSVVNCISAVLSYGKMRVLASRNA